MKKVTPATGNGPARYPRLANARKLLIAAAPLLLTPSLAGADASCPGNGDKNGGKTGKDATPQPPVHHYPHTAGVMRAPDPPPPTGKDKDKDKEKDKKKDEGAMWLHPHGPDEDCFPAGNNLRVKV
jgi:hypothetical protein